MKNKEAVKKIRSFNRFYTNIIGVVDGHILESPYSLTEVRLMFEIYNDPEPTARKIKNFLHIDEGYLSRTIDKLVKKGLIVRKQSSDDARKYILSLTKKGEKEFLLLNERSENVVEKMLSSLSAKEINDILTSVEKIEKILGGNR